jgi:hypothetical protein
LEALEPLEELLFLLAEGLVEHVGEADILEGVLRELEEMGEHFQEDLGAEAEQKIIATAVEEALEPIMVALEEQDLHVVDVLRLEEVMELEVKCG